MSDSHGIVTIVRAHGREALEGVLTLLRLWRDHLCYGGILARSLAWFFLFFFAGLLINALAGGVHLGIALLVINVELAAGYWMHQLGYSALETLRVCLWADAFLVGFWTALVAGIRYGWPAWSAQEKNQDAVKRLSTTADALSWLADHTDWRDGDTTRDHWLFRRRYLFLFLICILPGAFLFWGLPFAFKYNLRLSYPVIFAGNATKIVAFVLGWALMSGYVALVLFMIVIVVTKVCMAIISNRGGLF